MIFIKGKVVKDQKRRLSSSADGLPLHHFWQNFEKKQTDKNNNTTTNKQARTKIKPSIILVWFGIGLENASALSPAILDSDNEVLLKSDLHLSCRSPKSKVDIYV